MQYITIFAPSCLHVVSSEAQIMSGSIVNTNLTVVLLPGDSTLENCRVYVTVCIYLTRFTTRLSSFRNLFVWFSFSFSNCLVLVTCFSGFRDLFGDQFVWFCLLETVVATELFYYRYRVGPSNIRSCNGRQVVVCVCVCGVK